MKASGPREERETIIRFDEVDEKASIWTASDMIYRRLLKRLGTEYLTEDGERHAVFEFPAKWLTLPRVKTKGKANPHGTLALKRYHAERNALMRPQSKKGHSEQDSK